MSLSRPIIAGEGTAIIFDSCDGAISRDPRTSITPQGGEVTLLLARISKPHTATALQKKKGGVVKKNKGEAVKKETGTRNTKGRGQVGRGHDGITPPGEEG